MAQLPNRLGNSSQGAQIPENGDRPVTGGLRSWIVTKLEHARDARDMKYASRWKEYTRLWRGFWVEQDKNTDSERSRLIAPALQQAIEMTVAEIEEAVFNKSAWFDITDDIVEDNQPVATEYRDKLLEDFELDEVPDSLSKVFLLGAIYGTGIAKIHVGSKHERRMEDGQEVSTKRVAVSVEAVRPDEFVIDQSATTVDEALFVAHEMVKPLHTVQEKMDRGIYRKVDLEEFVGERGDSTGTGISSHIESDDNAVKITEYFGKVPAEMLPGAEDQEEIGRAHV
jgi:hypothetical protein